MGNKLRLLFDLESWRFHTVYPPSAIGVQIVGKLDFTNMRNDRLS